MQRPSLGRLCLFTGPGIHLHLSKACKCEGSFWFYSGAVGTAAVQIARALGAIVVGTAGTKDGMDVVTRYIFFQNIIFHSPIIRCGAHHVFNHNHKSYEKKMVSDLSFFLYKTYAGISMCQVDHIGCFDVIIEHLANINLGHDVQMLKPQARWI